VRFGALLFRDSAGLGTIREFVRLGDVAGSTSSIRPERAIVTPRAFAPESGDSLPLEDLVRPVLAADPVTRRDTVEKWWPRDALRGVASRIAEDQATLSVLAEVFLAHGVANRRAQPTAAALLVRAEPGWRPVEVRDLTFADLEGAAWPDVDLENADLRGAKLAGADLSRADLRGAKLHGSDFFLVDLREARYDDDQREHLVRTGAILT